MHILEFNVVGSSIIVGCRDIFCCTMKIKWEWGTVKMLCFHHVVDSVDDHTGSSDQWKTKNRVHAHLGPGGNDKKGWASISSQIWKMKLECHGEVRGNTLHLILHDSRQNNWSIILRKEDLGNAMGVLLGNGSKEVIISGAKGCCGVNDTSNAWV